MEVLRPMNPKLFFNPLIRAATIHPHRAFVRNLSVSGSSMLDGVAGTLEFVRHNEAHLCRTTKSTVAIGVLRIRRPTP